MVHNTPESDAFVKVYSEAIRWHYFGQEPPRGVKRPHKRVVSAFWPRQHPTGDELSAFRKGNLHRVPLLKRGTTSVPTYLEYDYPFNLVFEPSDKPRPEPDAEIPPVVPPVPVPLYQGNTGPNRPARQTAQPTVAGGHHEARKYGCQGHNRGGAKETRTPHGDLRPGFQTAKGGNPFGNWQLAHHEAQQPVHEQYGRGGRQATPPPWARQSEAHTPEGGKQSEIQTPKGGNQKENWQPPRANHRDRQRRPAYQGSQHGRRPESPSNPQMGRQQAAEAERRGPPTHHPTPARLGPYRVLEAPAEAGSTRPGYLSRRSSVALASSDDEDTRYGPVPRGYYQQLSAPEAAREESARREEHKRKREEGTGGEEPTAEAVQVQVMEPKSRPAATSHKGGSSPVPPAAKRGKARPTAAFWC
ncbi:hypothetical protein MMC27_007593 [Xylographa pallens]|nr:hypothetical protein [Xylographa pallens]